MPNIDLVVGNFSPYYNVNNLAQTHRKNLKHKPQSFPEKKRSKGATEKEIERERFYLFQSDVKHRCWQYNAMSSIRYIIRS